MQNLIPVHLLKWVYLIALSLIWGSSFILIKKGLTGYGYFEAATIRLMSAGAVLLPFGLLNFKKIPRSKIKFILLSSVIGMFGPAYLFCLAQEHIPSAVAGVLNALTPVFVFIFSLFIFKVAYKSVQILGLFIGLCSSILLVINRSHSEITFNAYALLIILATMGYGMNVNITKQSLGGLPSIVISTTTVTVAGLLAFIFGFLPNISQFHLNQANLMPLFSLICLGVLGTAVAQLLFVKMLSDTTALFASSVTYTMPIVAILWGIIDGEVFQWVHALSVIGILIGVVLIRRA
jgi:drug/metabolite transporter (DMT)-like permease